MFRLTPDTSENDDNEMIPAVECKTKLPSSINKYPT